MDEASIDQLLERGHLRRPLAEFFPELPPERFENCHVICAPGLTGAPRLTLTRMHDGVRRNITIVLVPERLSGSIELNLGRENLHFRLESEASVQAKFQLRRNATVRVGANTAMRGARFVCDNSDLAVGRDCLFSDNVLVQCSDQHAIIRRSTGEILNGHRRRVVIGDHVWLGRNTTVMPDVTIGTGSVIGAGALVTGDADAYSIYAGIPARKIRDDVTWSNSPAGPNQEERSRYFSGDPVPLEDMRAVLDSLEEDG
ncbi:acyltransferase [Oceanicella sp. SM1341]|uniref:acyltransferase n=1 Tax=Oceanicella sp. SM1341 TaxID=1548889 RepID=UPI0018E558E0|nr:acyltransferase [Oceanicella sp. SM1341]